MSVTLATVSYLGAIILFILSLGGLSNPETSRRGNLYGIVGMTIAVIATSAMLTTARPTIQFTGRSAAAAIGGATCTSAPIAMMLLIALVTLMSGVCSAGVTFQITM